MKFVNQQRVVLVIFILLILTSFVSCRNKKNNEEKTDQTVSHIPPDEERNQLVFGTSRAKDSPADSQTPQGFTETDKGDIKGQLLPVFSEDRIPEDMVIGPLLDISKADSDEVSFAAVITEFITQAGKGVISEDLLHPGWKDAILRVLGTDVVKTDYTLRIGRIVSEDGINRANIRIVSRIGRISGEVMAEKYDGKWLLSSIAVDFNQLKNLYVRENSEFSPLGYSNILLNY